LTKEHKHKGEKALNKKRETPEELEMETERAAEPVGTAEEIEKTSDPLEEAKKQAEENYERFLRVSAELENFKKRTAREKEEIFVYAAADVIEKFLPVLDNLERALSQTPEESPFADGVRMVAKQFGDVLEKLGARAIETDEQPFDPNLHNAVMHVEDEALGPNQIAGEFMKGYIYKDKVIRHSMVKVAN
jgi:molecular chaperone GrpE